MGQQYGLNDEEVYQAWGSFQQYDVDHSNSIDVNELKAILHGMLRMKPPCLSLTLADTKHKH